MQTLLATQVASISELKRNPSKLINDAHGRPVVILHQIVEQRLSDSSSSVRVDIDEL